MIRKTDFLKEYKAGVTVTISQQTPYIMVRRLRPIPQKALALIPQPRGFKLIRQVINIELVDLRANKQPVETFEPPIEVHVRYTQKDMAAAGGKLRLVYLFNNQWFYFAEKNHSRLISDPNPENGGEGVVTISRWDDPMIGWGL